MKNIFYPFIMASAVFALSACTDESVRRLSVETDDTYVITAPGTFTAE